MRKYTKRSQCFTETDRLDLKGTSILSVQAWDAFMTENSQVSCRVRSFDLLAKNEDSLEESIGSERYQDTK